MSVFSTREGLSHIRAMLAEGHPCQLVVTGNSMWPFLRHRADTVILVPLSRDPRPGDILFYLRREDFCILHRVIRREEDGMLTLCGDAQTYLESVHTEQILGVASHIRRRGRLISCGGPVWTSLSALWRWLLPIRPLLLRLGRAAAGAKHWILNLFTNN